MIHEKKVILLNILIAVAFLVICIIIIAVISTPEEPATFIGDEGYVDTYYEAIEETSCEIVLKFDKELYKAEATVSFYDADSNLLDVQTKTFYGYDETELSELFFVDGIVEYYSVDNVNVEEPEIDSDIIFVDIILGIIVGGFFLCIAFLSCKEYDHEQCKIVVYAGWTNHYMKVNGVKVDEHRTTFSLVPITLSTTLETGDVITATISVSNRISVKFNNRLIQPNK